MAWKIGISKLHDVITQGHWDGTTAENEIYTWAGIDLETNDVSNVDLNKVQQGFLFYNDVLEDLDTLDITKIRTNTSYPLVRIINNKPTVIREGLSSALSFLNRVPANVPVGVNTQLSAIGRTIVEDYIRKYNQSITKLLDYKVGKRHNITDYELIQEIHDLTKMLGADCNSYNHMDDDEYNIYTTNEEYMVYDDEELYVSDYRCTSCNTKRFVYINKAYHCMKCGQKTNTNIKTVETGVNWC